LNTALILLPDFILMIFAWGLNRFTFLNREIWVALEKIVYWILFPALLIASASRAKLVWEDNVPMLLLLAVGMISMALIAYSAKWIWQPEPVSHHSGIQTTFRFNTFIAFAVALRLGGEDGLALMAIAVASLVPLSNALSIISLSRNSQRSVLLELVKNPFVIATVFGLFINLCNIRLPDFIHSNLQRMGSASITIGLMTVGASLSWVSAKKDMALVFFWTTLKLVIFPLFVFTVGQYVLHLPKPQLTTAVVIACVPTATSAFVMATRMGGNGPIVSVTISLMTIGAAFTMPFWIALVQSS
jgi:predicted permease